MQRASAIDLGFGMAARRHADGKIYFDGLSENFASIVISVESSVESKDLSKIKRD